MGRYQETYHVQTLLRSMRVPFLVLTPACQFLAVSALLASGVEFKTFELLMVLLAALCAHISVNCLNEYQDFTSGLDHITDKTPFSGGSGALPEHPAGANAVLLTALLALACCMAIGVYFVYLRGPLLLLPGVAGVLIILTYTRWLNRMPWLCLVAPGIAFGPLMVAGTFYALSGTLNALAVVLSLLPFFLVNNLLLLNQLPDIQADKTVGRDHFPIRYGIGSSKLVYAAFCASAILLLLTAVASGNLPVLSLVALLPLLAAVVVIVGARRYTGQSEQLLPLLALNVVAAVVTPVILGLSLLMARA